MKKKILVGLLAVSMSLAMLGCGDKDEENAKASETTEITATDSGEISDAIVAEGSASVSDEKEAAPEGDQEVEIPAGSASTSDAK